MEEKKRGRKSMAEMAKIASEKKALRRSPKKSSSVSKGIIDESIPAPKKSLKWDVTHEMAVALAASGEFYFDPELSYETTGYRPINKTNGLDFDPAPFQEQGVIHSRTGSYTPNREGSILHTNYWNEQIRRCEEGYTVGEYRIPGDYYFFLNFYILPIVSAGTVAGETSEIGHPKFIDMQYEWFHYVELAKLLGYNIVALKGRGIGWSEVGASMVGRPSVTKRGYECAVTAYSKNHLDVTLNKIWDLFDNLNTKTDGGMRRRRDGGDTQDYKLISVKLKNGDIVGRKNKIYGRVVNDADKVRGLRCHLIVMEECGADPIMQSKFNAFEALINVGGIKKGIILAFGTGGSDSKTSEGFFEAYLRPKDFNVLPYRHNHTKTGQYVLTGFFAPSSRYSFKATPDNRGYLEVGDYWAKERNVFADNPMKRAKARAEFCYTQEEAMNRIGSGMFNQEFIAEQRVKVEENIAVDGIFKVKRGFLRWLGDPVELIRNNVRDKVEFVPNHAGDIEVIEYPDEFYSSSNEFKNVYVAGIDSIDHGSTESTVGADGSKFCIVVKRRYGEGYLDNGYVCKYLARPSVVDKAYDTALKIVCWYNCIANLEDTKIGLKQYFNSKWAMRYLMKRPGSAVSGSTKSLNIYNAYGTPASEKMIRFGLELVATYIEYHCTKIYDPEMLEQLQEYTYENKTLYDIVAAMQMAEIADLELGKVVKKKEVSSYKNLAYGYYIDGEGTQLFGFYEKDSIEKGSMGYNGEYIGSSGQKIIYNGHTNR